MTIQYEQGSHGYLDTAWQNSPPSTRYSATQLLKMASCVSESHQTLKTALSETVAKPFIDLLLARSIEALLTCANLKFQERNSESVLQ